MTTSKTKEENKLGDENPIQSQNIFQSLKELRVA